MKKKIASRIGFMQGRLSPIYKNKIQSFPWNNWHNELVECKKININLMEWTLDYPKLMENPLIKNTEDTFKILKKNNISLNSVTCDFFMQKPFFKNRFTKEINVLKKIIKTLKNYKIILVIPLVDNSSVKNINEENYLKRVFLTIYKNQIKFSKLKICFESDFPPSKLKNFISYFPKHKFGINYDTGNSASLGYNCVEEIDKLKNRIYNIHIKDRKFKSATTRLGSGDFDFKNFFKK